MMIRWGISIEKGKKNAGKVANSPSIKARLVNRFAILDTISDNEEINEEDTATCSVSIEKENFEPRKSHVAAVGVAKLMKTLKPKKKAPLIRAKRRIR